MTPEEKAVIDVALALIVGVRGGIDPASLDNDLEAAVDALIFSCPQCNAGGHTCPGDGNSIGHTQMDCGQHEEPDHSPGSADVLGVYCDDPKHCPPEPLTGAIAPEWVPATLLSCLAGDHIRMGADETDVTRSSAGIWHADISNAWQPKAWRHTELRMDLTANPGFQQYPPNLECEILCTPERKATLLLQRAFPGSVIVSSDVD